MKRHLILPVVLTAVAILCGPSPTIAQTAATAVKPAATSDAVSRGVAFLAQQQANDGSYSASAGPGVTAIVATALLNSGRTADDPVVARALKYLQGNLHPDGGIYQEGGNHKNYETALAIMAFQAANKDGRYKDLLAAAEKFVKTEQWDEGEKIDVSDMKYGGAGYGSSSRPDLSNTSFLLDALHAVGRGDDDPALQKSLIFVSRCQNLEGEHNTSPFAAKVNDGGFYYTVAAGGASMAGPSPEGGLRSYGSMTYAGLKSMIYAGLKRDDPRVQAAHKWVSAHYTFDENPGMGEQGLYYYLHAAAKALKAMDEAQIVDAAGKSHDWRSELQQKVISLQKEDGSWVNSNARWLEGDPNLVTSYGLLVLSYCQSK